ncbi:MAG: beta-eliminating lyase-related protein [Acholeplasma sp.]|nr:beta-eliminating lyase-related protein [Acholeplasma sp.]
MINFKNDYSDIAHEKILERLINLKQENHTGYGIDQHTELAKKHIQAHITKEVDIHFMGGGTITNKTVIAHILKPYEAVISARTGHIVVHETGAIEQTGHKILCIDTLNGKVTPKDVLTVFHEHTDEHMVKPKLLYLSCATETGEIYTKKELIKLSKVTHELGMWLYIDGARLGVSLTSEKNDLSLNDYAEYTDIFYIGGTKNGALFGEALVICNNALKENFRYSIKQNGGLLAKGFLTAIQFQVLFEDGLFFDIAKKANESSSYLVNELKETGVSFESTPTNQQFIVLDNTQISILSQTYLFEIWSKGEHQSKIRLVTTYQTEKANIDLFIKDLNNLLKK